MVPMLRSLAPLPLVLACAFACAAGPGQDSSPTPGEDRFRRKALKPQAVRLADDDEQGTGSPRVVARMQITVPKNRPFVLHGTLPVPPDFVWPAGEPALELAPPRGPRRATPRAARASGAEAVAGTPEGEADAQPGAKNNDGVLAQVDVLVRDSTGRPAVVELAALVDLPAEVRPGRVVEFDVRVASKAVASLAAQDPRPFGERVARLLTDPGSGPFALRTRDVFGNEYRVDLRPLAADSGNLLGRAPGSVKQLASGPAKRTRRVHGALQPVPNDSSLPGSGDGAPLPHLMGVHAYITEWAADGYVSLDLRIHNGMSAGSRSPHPIEAPIGFVYWDALELLLPADWAAAPLFEDPFLGEPRAEEIDGQRVTVLPLVKGYASGALHMMPPQAQFHRRLLVRPADESTQAPPRLSVQDARSNPALAGLAFCTASEGLWSWFDPATASYFPQRALLCTWERFRRNSLQANPALRERFVDELFALRQVVAKGERSGSQIVSGVMGWAHPFGAPAAGVTGGGGIVFLEGQRAAASASRERIEALMLEHRMNASRQAEAAWNASGEPVGYHEWLKSERIPFDFRTNGRMVPPAFALPSRGGPRPDAHVAAVFDRALRPPYDRGAPQQPGGEQPGRESIVAWLPHDGQHMVRYTKNTKALVWLAADPLARDDLMLSAELFRLMFHESPHRQEAWSSGVTLLEFEKHARRHPGQGAWIGRDQAWGIDSMSAAFALADDAWRERNLEWFRRVGRFLLKAAMPSGVLQRSSNNKIVGDERYDGAQAYETLFLTHAMRCLNEAVLAGRNERLRGALEALVLRTVDFLYSDAIFATVRAPRPPHQERSGPRAQFAVALRDGYEKPPFSDSDHWGPTYLPPGGLAGGVELTYAPSLLGYAFRLSRASGPKGLANPYLRHLLRGRKSGWADLVAELFLAAQRPSNDNSGNWAGLVGELQALGL